MPSQLRHVSSTAILAPVQRRPFSNPVPRTNFASSMNASLVRIASSYARDLASPVFATHDLDLLNVFRSHFQSSGTHPLADVLYVSTKHALRTVVDQLQYLQELGLTEGIIGTKPYSDNPDNIIKMKALGLDVYQMPEPRGYGEYNTVADSMIHDMWREVLQRIKERETPFKTMIVDDDGIRLLVNIPKPLLNGLYNKPENIVGIVHTNGGANQRAINGFPFPIINLAGCFVKKLIEYRAVAKVIFNQINIAIEKYEICQKLGRPPVIGVIGGEGVMGSAVTAKIREQGFEVVTYDSKSSDFSDANIVDTLTALVMKSDLIIGCTGTNVFNTANVNGKSALQALMLSPVPKWLCSASSGDEELRALLEEIQYRTKQVGKTPDILADIVHANDSRQELVVIRGGTPINFQNTDHSVPPREIVVTRLLSIAAAMQAANMSPKQLQSTHIFKLDPQAQLRILRNYMEINPDDPALASILGKSDQGLLRQITNESKGIDPHQASSSPDINSRLSFRSR